MMGQTLQGLVLGFQQVGNMLPLFQAAVFFTQTLILRVQIP